MYAHNTVLECSASLADDMYTTNMHHTHTVMTYQGRRVVEFLGHKPHGLPAQACMTTTGTNKGCTNWDL